MSTLLDVVEKEQLRDDLPFFPVGSTVRVNYWVVEGDKQRLQPYEGVVIRKHLGDRNNKATFTVRKMVQNSGVERIFPMHSPRIENIKVLKIGKVRRAKLYYLRERRGKAARIQEKIMPRAPKS